MKFLEFLRTGEPKMTSSYAQALEIALKQQGFKITPQRRMIINVLQQNSDKHLTAEEILKKVHSKNHKIGLATVYRTLAVLSNLGLINRLEIKGEPTRFELKKREILPHQHLICLSCGKVTEVTGLLCSDFKNNLLRNHDFFATDCSVKVLGYCKRCQKNPTSIRSFRITLCQA